MSSERTPFWRSGTFWSLVIAAVGQVVEAAFAPGAGPQRFFQDQLPPELAGSIAAAGDPLTWLGLIGAFWRRAVATRPWTF